MTSPKEKAERSVTAERMQYIKDLWAQFGDIPMDPLTECLEVPFIAMSEDGARTVATFAAGTFREDIWHWFEEQFHLSVAEDLMYD